MASNEKIINEIIGLVNRLGEQTTTSGEATRNIVAVEKALETAKAYGQTALVEEGEKLLAILKEDESEGSADRVLYRSLHRVLKGQGYIKETAKGDAVAA